ncbi:hypothetical protein K0C01_12055 [Salinarchaeum sp. IM2453]|uniref:hypothetical protein n=1 Tax=Salinarchaeum sp. IM2453 TaxID=2862870 RepID=UPI001C83DDEB|nr:hypothetical protein [Salinarchaeum sp. IM2453]QZA88496.1 hypothetical protein K0C01_12055 [Salinarchaeum sp. IM2453]
MNRRNFILGLGASTAGAVVTIGSGAFTSVEADREVSVEVVDDTDAYLSPVPLDDNGEVPDDPSDNDQLRVPGAQDEPYAQIDNDTGRLILTFGALNSEATTRISQVFRVTNEGDDEVGLWFEVSGSSPDVVTFTDQDGNELNDGSENAVDLTVGESVDVDIEFDTSGVGPDDEIIDTITLNADQEVAS